MKKIEQIKLVAELLGLPYEKIQDSYVDLDDSCAIYFSEPVKGGRSIIVSEDGSVLYADSSVSKEEHIQAFLNGVRTPIESFDKCDS